MNLYLDFIIITSNLYISNIFKSELVVALS